MDSILNTIKQFSQKNVILIGDTIVDKYIYGTRLGLSAETPTIVAKETSKETSLGGAFLVCRNLLNLGATVHFITVAGNDEEGDVIRRFTHPKLHLHLLSEESKKTTAKIRYWVDGYKLLQFDQLDNSPISENNADQIISIVKDKLPETDMILISDYRHGLLEEELIRALVTLTNETETFTLVDSQISQTPGNHLSYRGASLFCLNRLEALTIDTSFRFNGAPSDFATLKEKLECDRIIIKNGEKGAMAYIQGTVIQSDAVSVKVVDTCGAGDAFLAALSLCYLQNPEQALRVANLWAALSITQHGTTAPNIESLYQQLQKEVMLV